MRVVTCKSCGTKNRVDETRLARHEAKCGKCKSILSFDAGSSPDEQKPIVVSDQTFGRDVVDASAEKPVVLDCWAPWCGPCRIVAPIMDQLAAESRGRYRVAKLNVDENPRTAAQFHIASIPTMLIFKRGQLVDQLIGAQSKEVIATRLAVAANA